MKTEFMNLYEELNKLNEDRLVEKKANTISYVFAIFEDCYRDAGDLHYVGKDEDEARDKFEELKEGADEYRGPNYPLYLVEYSEVIGNALTEDQFIELESLINKADSDSNTIKNYFKLGFEIDSYEADELEYDEESEYDDSDQEALDSEDSMSNIEIEELIDDMESHGQLPPLSKGEINDIYDDEGVSTISFGHIDAPIYVGFGVSCDDRHQNRIILNYEVTIHEQDDLDEPQYFSHKTEVLNNQDPESCIKYIYKIVENADELADAGKVGVEEFNNKLQDQGYEQDN